MTQSSTQRIARAENDLDDAINRAKESLLAAQKPDGHFSYEFEADATIPAEYLLLTHYLGEKTDPTLERKIGVYLRHIQNAEGGWPLFPAGAFDMSASVKAYFALKMAGDSPEAEHMRRARAIIQANGGAEQSNVFTRFMLCLYGILSWRAVPLMPVEIVLLPKWFPFHMSRISYWARTVMTPMLVLQVLKPKARNPRGVTIDELFLTPPKNVGPRRRAPHQKRGWFLFFNTVDAILHRLDPYFPKSMRARAMAKAEAFVRERLNGDSGLGAIFPAMANSVMMLDALGVSHIDPSFATARLSVEKLLIVKDEEAYCQPCVSPVWDSALAAHALFEAGAESEAVGALRWLRPRQILDIMGDWKELRPDIRPGGWPFQYANPHYPDLDDTAVVVMAMDRARKEHPQCAGEFDEAIDRAREWIVGMQSRNGGFASFEVDNLNEYLNNIPFSDHGALLDPPTSDVTARCVSMLAQLGTDKPAMQRGIDFLLREQMPDGSWFGRWGMNYVYGTWSVVCALMHTGYAPDSAPLKKAAAWLLQIQNEDGGWGEDGSSYKLDYKGYEKHPSVPSQTAWALLALMAMGHTDSTAVQRGVNYLLRAQNESGGWRDVYHNAPGFPRIFYLCYHGYAQYFTLWALARYRALKGQLAKSPAYGM